MRVAHRAERISLLRQSQAGPTRSALWLEIRTRARHRTSTTKDSMLDACRAVAARRRVRCFMFGFAGRAPDEFKSTPVCKGDKQHEPHICDGSLRVEECLQRKCKDDGRPPAHAVPTNARPPR